MQIVKHNVCIAQGCGKQSHGKAYCAAHLKGKRPMSVIPPEVRSLIRSDCCEATCVSGVRHEYGEQYCKHCGEACRWKTP